MYRLRLEDGVDFISFIDDTTYKLIDGTFSMSVPEAREVTTEYAASWANSLDSRNYGPREVTFEIQVVGATRDAVVAGLERLYAMVVRSQSDAAAGGGGRIDYTYTPHLVVGQQGNPTGYQGLQLAISIGSTDTSSVTGEFSQSYTSRNETRFYVISMDIAGENPMSYGGISYNGDEWKAHGVTIELRCSAFGYGDPISVSLTPAPTGNGYQAVPNPYSAGSLGARVVVSAASVPGSGEALTRITTNMSDGGDGIIIARDAGNSLINTPGAFYNTTDPDSAPGQYIIPVGYSESTQNYYDVQVVARNPVQLRHRTNGGSWSSSLAMNAHEIRWIVPGGYGYFVTTTDFTTTLIDTNDILRSLSTQYYCHNGIGAITIASAPSTFLSESGYPLIDYNIVVPSGIHGKYKLLAPTVANSAVEYRALIFYMNSDTTTRGAYTQWVSPPVGYSTIDFGEIDTTPRGMPHNMQPGSYTNIVVRVYARLLSTTYSGTVNQSGLWIVPCGDERSYLRAGWVVDSAGFEVFSNFDPRYPYLSSVSVDYRQSFTGVDGTYESPSIPLDETHEGTPITLIPGVTNTLLIIPLFSGGGAGDYRRYIPSVNPQTNYVTMAIRPSYLLAR